MNTGQEQTKLCRGCHKVKPYSKFGKELRSKIGIKPRCKECTNAYNKEYYNEEYRFKKIKQVKNYYDKSPTKKNVLTDEQKEKRKAYLKEYRKNNKEKINNLNKKYVANKRKEDPEFKALLFMRKQIYRCLNKKDKNKVTKLGYSKKQLVEHLKLNANEKKAIDHKVPLSWFNPSAPLSIVNHLDNLQLISASENSKKGNMWSTPIPLSYYLICIEHVNKHRKTKIKWTLEHTGVISTTPNTSGRMRSTPTSAKYLRSKPRGKKV